MKHTFILLSCLLSFAILQAEPLSAGCCKKKKPSQAKEFIQNIYFSGGCGCGGGGGGGSNEIPPDNNG